MTDDEDHSRLDQIQTRWSLICRSGDASKGEAGLALQTLALRYAPAIRRYVFAITRDDDVADELAQEIVVRLLAGQLADVDAQKGRFRDFLKVVIRNTVRNHWRTDNRHAARFGADNTNLEAAAADENSWDEVVRQHVVDGAWEELRQHEAQHPTTAPHTILKLRVAHPELDTTALAEVVSRETGRQFSADALRQQLHRARQLMKQLLRQEIADGLRDPSEIHLDEELAALKLKSWLD